MASVPESPAIAVRCSVSGAKWLGVSLTESEICARFVARLGLKGPVSVAGDDTPMTGDGLSFALRFERLGRAIADITRFSGGVAQAQPSRELAVMDRALAITDVDRLADYVAADLGAKPNP